MANLKTVQPKELFMGRLTHGGDLIEELTQFCIDNGIRLGRIEAIGAVQRARIGYYDQVGHEYRFLDMDRRLEIISLIGNISLKDGEPMVHAHITLGDEEGKAFGGHLAPGTIIFACECVIQVLDGAQFVRTFDEQTKLMLWDIP